MIVIKYVIFNHMYRYILILRTQELLNIHNTWHLLLHRNAAKRYLDKPWIFNCEGGDTMNDFGEHLVMCVLVAYLMFYISYYTLMCHDVSLEKSV